MYETFPEDNQERSYGIIPLRIAANKDIEVLVIQQLVHLTHSSSFKADIMTT